MSITQPRPLKFDTILMYKGILKSKVTGLTTDTKKRKEINKQITNQNSCSSLTMCQLPPRLHPCWIIQNAKFKAGSTQLFINFISRKKEVQIILLRSSFLQQILQNHQIPRPDLKDSIRRMILEQTKMYKVLWVSLSLHQTLRCICTSVNA